MSVSVSLGDCVEALKGRALDAALFDSCVTDPPYHLTSIVKRFGGTGAAPAKSKQTGAFARASAGFMGQKWDGGDVAFRPETWRAVYDALKPGAHLVAFSGTRTFHRMVCAIEDAGFEIRDTIFWCCGSGFPKSHDVAKGIAKRRAEDIEPMRVICRFVRAAMDDQGLKSRDLTHVFDDCNPRLIDHWAARDTDSQPALPTAFQWALLTAHLGLHGRDGFPAVDAEFTRLNSRKGERSDEWTGAEVIGEIAGPPPGFGVLRFDGDRTLRKLDEDAAEWQGWGTALKPAVEPICLARKPLSEKSVAANVLRWGTGALNIEGCRVHAEDARGYAYEVKRTAPGAHQNATGETKLEDRTYAGETQDGRWPANLVHDGSDEVLAAFPRTSSGTGAIKRESAEGYQRNALGKESRPAGTPMISHGDEGSAARFFYTAKAGPLDRLGSPHPTIKPVDLMRWLCRLVTPPGGLILDPFAGSGSTGIAAMAEGFDCEMIDIEEKHVADIRRKLAIVQGEGRHRMVEMNERKAGKQKPLGGLFGEAA